MNSIRSSLAAILLIVSVNSASAQIGPDGTGTVNGYFIGPDVNYQWVNLSGTDLAGANLTGANLIDAILTGADLTGADLTGANLSGAILTEAIFIGVDLTSTALFYVKYCKTKMPSGELNDDCEAE